MCASVRLPTPPTHTGTHPDWAAAFTAAGIDPPPATTLALELPAGLSLEAAAAAFGRLAARAAATAASRSDDALARAAFAALGGGPSADASVDALRAAADAAGMTLAQVKAALAASV